MPSKSEHPIPDRPVTVAWRGGLDLNPLDITDPDSLAWLDALVWPGEEHLRDQLHAAAAIARAEPPHLVRGNLVTDLAALLVEAPTEATLVVFHTAVLSYVDDPGDRQQFATTVTNSRAIWLANESPGWLPGLDHRQRHPRHDRLFLLCRDGQPLAQTDPHGSSIDWLPG
jgi:hypothetical protein